MTSVNVHYLFIKFRLLANIEFLVAVSYILGPALGALFSFVNIHICSVNINDLTSPGYFSGTVASLSFLMTFFFFKEVKPSSNKIDAALILTEQGPTARKNPFVIFLLLLCYFLLFDCLSVYETIATPFTIDQYNWNVRLNGLLWAATGICSIGSALFVKFATKFIGDVQLLMLQTALLATAFAILVSLSHLALWRFLVGTVLVALNFSGAATDAISIFSKSINPNKQEQYMGVLTGFGAGARLAGPIWASNLYTIQYGPAIIFGITGIGLIINLVLLLTLLISRRLPREATVPGESKIL